MKDKESQSAEQKPIINEKSRLIAQDRKFSDLFTVKKPSDYLPNENYSNNRSKSPHDQTILNED